MRGEAKPAEFDTLLADWDRANPHWTAADIRDAEDWQGRKGLSTRATLLLANRTADLDQEGGGAGHIMAARAFLIHEKAPLSDLASEAAKVPPLESVGLTWNDEEGYWRLKTFEDEPCIDIVNNEGSARRHGRLQMDCGAVMTRSQARALAWIFNKFADTGKIAP